MIQRSRAYLDPDGLPSGAMLQSALKEHIARLPRLEKLRRYYEGDNDILRRTRATGLPNNRIAHPFGRYIASVTAGYLIGQPAAYTMGDGAPSETLDAIVDLYARGSVESVDMENAHNAAVYGRGIEYVHVDADATPHSTALSPADAFVVYEDTYDMTPLFGVYMAPKLKETGGTDGFRVWVMTDRLIVEYYAKDLTAAAFAEVARESHYFGGVPLVEYWNDEDERGDFEWVIPLIDAYDKLESDRVNDKEQYVDKLIVMTGCVLEKDDQGRTPGQQLREDKLLALPDSDASVEYLSSALDEANVEVQRQALEADIHKLSMVPDLTDREFAANASGVAMRYKLWGLDQLIRIKERWFIEGLRERLKLYAEFMAVKGLPVLDVSGVNIALSRSMPANTLEQAQIAQYAKAADAASARERVAILHRGEGWTDDQIDADAERIRMESGIPGSDPTDVGMGDLERRIQVEDDAR